VQRGGEFDDMLDRQLDLRDEAVFLMGHELLIVGEIVSPGVSLK